MIKLKKLIEENQKYEYGCIMGVLDPTTSKIIVDLNNSLISDDVLYNEEGKEYGREKEPHITIKFGLTKEYTKEEIGKVVSHIKPFTVNITEIDVFDTNEDFDVVKFNVNSEELNRLNKLFSKLPNEDTYKTYHPHLTLAYVIKGEGTKFKRKMDPIEITIDKIKYSNLTNKYFYNL